MFPDSRFSTANFSFAVVFRLATSINILDASRVLRHITWETLISTEKSIRLSSYTFDCLNPQETPWRDSETLLY